MLEESRYLTRRLLALFSQVLTELSIWQCLSHDSLFFDRVELQSLEDLLRPLSCLAPFPTVTPKFFARIITVLTPTASHRRS